jgi:hypothetical protein
VIASRTALLLALAASPASAGEGNPSEAWWQRLQALCGQAFAGEVVRMPADDTVFRGQPLVIHVRDCTPERVRIPLVVGEDRSRTWVLSRREGRIELKHEHRHADGSFDAVTNYGGLSSNAGSADSQLFPADEDTRLAIPGSGLRSVWLIEIHPGERLVYAANRVGTERGFRIDFDLSRVVPEPEAAW